MRMKKFLAFLIVLALTASLIPTAFAAREAVNYNYVFNTAAHFDATAELSERRLTSGLHTINNMAETSVSSPWGFVNAYGCNTPVSYSGYILWEIQDKEGVGVTFAPGVSDTDVPGIRSAIVFEISASEGIYDASLSVTTGTSPATEVEVYLIPKEEYNIPSDYTRDPNTNLGTFSESFYKEYIETLSANYRIGKIDLYDKSGDVYIGRTKLSQSNYYLVLVPCGVKKDTANKNSWIINLTNFKLDTVSESAGEPNVEEFNAAEAFAYRNSGASYTESTENNVFSTEDILVRRYGVTTGYGPFAAFKVSVDTAGKYNIGFKTNKVDDTQAAPAVYISNMLLTSATKDMNSITDKEKIGYIDFSELTAVDTYETVTTDGLSSGTVAEYTFKEANKDYYIILAPDGKSLSLNGKTTTRTLVEGTDYLIPDTGAITDTDGNAFSNNTFVGKQKLYISGIQLTQVMEPSEEEVARQEAYTADRKLYNTLTNVTAENNKEQNFDVNSLSGTVTVVAQDIETGEPITGSVENEVTKVNEKYTPVAPSVSADYEFMYWAMGIGDSRKIVSFDKDKYSFKVAPERNMVYAVCRKTNSDKKYAFFFDGSKTFMEKRVISNGTVTLPDLPGAMPGFGNATGWKYTGEENEKALDAGIAVENLTDDTFFVADYNDKKTVTVTIDGTPVQVPYGEDVKLGDYASIRENKSGENVFNYWKKGEEIISFKPDYTFKAYEDCALTSTYAKYEPINKTVRRILISADAETGITFAEFIGLDSAIEKGILFGDAGATYTNANAKAVMQTDGKVFSVVNETGKTAIGYAILEGGSIVYSDR